MELICYLAKWLEMNEKNTITDQEKDRIKAILKNREAMEARNPKDHYY